MEISEKQKVKTGVEVVWDIRIRPFMDQQSYRLLGIDMDENRNSTIHLVVAVANVIFTRKSV
jgi:hypothetical protein